MKRVMISAGAAGLAAFAYGQQSVQPGERVVAGTAIAQFFVAVIAGVILAAAFQMFLVNLGGAVGLRAAGSAIAPKPRSKRQEKKASEPKRSVGETLEHAQAGIRKMTSGLGLAVLVISTISLFFAAWFAVRLSGTATAGRGALLGLVIWGVSYVVSMVLEIGAASALIGAVVSGVKRTLWGGYRAAASIFGSSPESRAADIAESISSKVRDELLGKQNVKELLESYLKRQETVFNPQRIRRELEELLDDTEIEFLYREGGDGTQEDRLVARFTSGGMSPDKARQAATGVRKAVETIRDERSKGKAPVETAVDAGLRMVGMSPQQAESDRRKVEDYLRSTGREELRPEAIKHDLETLFRDPKAGLQAFKDRLSRIDRNTVSAILAQRKDMNRDEAAGVTDRVLDAVQNLIGSAKEKTQGAKEAAGDVQGRTEAKLRDYLDSLGKPELQYEGIKADVEKLLHDPKEGAESLLNRLKAIDRDTIKAMLARRKDISDEDAERIVSRVEEARDTVIAKAQELEAQVERKAAEARDEAMRQAEEASKTAATATLWSFLAALISGGAAIVGGLIGAH